MEAKAIDSASQLLHDVERELTAQINVLRSLADTPALDLPANLPGFRALATRFVAAQPHWDRIILADMQGRQVVNTYVPLGTNLPPVVDEASYRRVLDTGAPVIGDLTGPGPFGDRVMMVSIRVPVVRDGRTIFVLTALVAQGEVASLLPPAGLDPAWRPFVIDGADHIVAAPSAPQQVGSIAQPPAVEARRNGMGGIYRGRTASGIPVVTAFRKSETTGWSAHVSIPLDIYNAPLARSFQILGGAGLGSLTLSLLFGLVLRREILEGRKGAAAREHAARMEAIGRIAGGVAHDINNVLMVVLGNAEILARRAAGTPLERHVGSIRKAAEKGSHLTSSLLAFSRKDARRIETVDLDERARNVVTMARESIEGPDIVLDLALDAPQAMVEIDPIQFDLALLNLAVNARDAMPNGGRLVIATRLEPAPDRSGRAGVALSVSDTGIGIPRTVLPHVFEPFFTTKPIGKGTGLGLSQVYGFASASGGTAEVESEVGEGTTVTLRLPLAKAAPEPQATLACPVATDPTRCRILLVDDDEEVRTLSAAFLAEAGYEICQADSAATALDLLRSEPVDALVSDLVMPGAMDGLQLARKARDDWPGLPILLVTGVSGSAATAGQLGFPILAKPFPMEDLAAAVRRLLAPAEGRAAEAERAPVQAATRES